MKANLYTLGEKKYISGLDRDNKAYVRSLKGIRWYASLEEAFDKECINMEGLGVACHNLAYQWLENKLPLKSVGALGCA